MKVSSLVKCTVQLCLLATFVCLFGVPFVTRYLDKQVMTVTSVTYASHIHLPAITVVAYNSTNGGWKQPVPTADFEALAEVCGEAVDIQACVVQNSRSRAWFRAKGVPDGS